MKTHERLIQVRLVINEPLTTCDLVLLRAAHKQDYITEPTLEGMSEQFLILCEPFGAMKTALVECGGLLLVAIQKENRIIFEELMCSLDNEGNRYIFLSEYLYLKYDFPYPNEQDHSK